MPIAKIPLVGQFNPRGPVDNFSKVFTTGKDQKFQGVYFDVVKNPVTQTSSFYCSKMLARRYTYTIDDSHVGYSYANEIVSTEYIDSSSVGRTWVIVALGNSSWIGSSTASQIFAGRPDAGVVDFDVMGTLTGGVSHMVETIIGGVQTFLITCTDGTGWFLGMDAVTSTGSVVNTTYSTFTADTTSGSAVLANVSSFAGRYVGQALSGTGIATGARIQSMNSGAGTITMTANATANGSGVTVSAERIAKIIDSDFPSNIIGPFASLDGFHFVMTLDGKIYNSNLNSIASWTAGDYVSTNFFPDNGRGGVWIVGGNILGFGASSGEWFYNAGNPSGSPLLPIKERNFNVGIFNSRCALQIGGRFYWISSPDRGAVSLYYLNGSTPQEIDSPQINAMLCSDGSASVEAVVTGFKFAGKTFLIIGGYLVYDVDLNLWASWESAVYFTRATGIYSSGLYNQSMRGDVFYISSNSDSVYYITTGSSSASIANIAGSLSIRTSRLDLGSGNRKSVEYYELDSDIQSAGTVTLEVSDDDYATWTTVGTFDMTKHRPRIYRGGSFLGGRAHRLTGSSTDPFRASALTIKYTEGAH